MPTTSRELRTAFLRYFEGHGHTPVASAPLIPRDDPTLLFNNAGMVPFKRIFTGQEKSPSATATSVQKCLRAGGKHNDLENVGHTGRHHTFFEMLGNFSFGDYFKAEAIHYAWDFLIHTVGLPKDRLWVSVYTDDDEAYALWRDQEGVPESRILRLGEKDNFWRMGDTGPCGPCTEIHLDQGESIGCGRPTCRVGCDDEYCDRYLEIWNLVFMQYEQNGPGDRTPLPKPSIDTGMGLERLAAVCQGVSNNYDTDLFLPIIHTAADLAHITYGDTDAGDTALRVIADHTRALAFLLADGVLPANDGRGYVLRRILRRAARYGRTIGLNEPFLDTLTGTVVDQMGTPYPELVRARDSVARITRGEEERFAHTLDQGLGRLNELLDQTAAGGMVAGDGLFNLYDTYGFPVDLAADVAAERGLSVDLGGFDAAMAAQKERARASWKGADLRPVDTAYGTLAATLDATTFTGYDHTEDPACVVRAVLKDGQPVTAAEADDAVEVVLSQTPFYAESGGQVGDRGQLLAQGADGLAAVVRITDTQRQSGGLVAHHGRVESGRLETGQTVTAQVDTTVRKDIARNHTATHLLHATLRDILGDHVKQAGSLVAVDRLRFDFTHFSPLSAHDLERVEDVVNEHIRDDIRVQTEVRDLDSAIADGAMALFGEKYDDDVRVVQVAGVSTELCGGTHCNGVGEIGLLRILSEGSVGAGVRRIEAVTGRHALHHIRHRDALLVASASVLKASPEALADKAEQLLTAIKERDRRIDQLQLKVAEGSDADETVETVHDVTVLVRRDHGLDASALRQLADRVRDRIGTGAALLAAVDGDRIHLVCLVSKDLIDRLKAGDLMRAIAPLVDGRGGGRPDMAQGGGDKPSGYEAAVDQFRAEVATRLAP